jgi:hypothetical protein
MDLKGCLFGVILCWYVYRQSVLVIDGKNNNNVGRFIGRVCMSRTTTKTQKKNLENLRRNSAELHAKRKCVLGPREMFSKAQERQHFETR